MHRQASAECERTGVWGCLQNVGVDVRGGKTCEAVTVRRTEFGASPISVRLGAAMNARVQKSVQLQGGWDVSHDSRLRCNCCM